jgi:DNA processing protein
MGPHDLPFDNYAQAMTSEESVALVALLRDRPGGQTWTELTASVLEYGSARALRDELRTEELLEDPAFAATTEEARRDIEAWIRSGLQFVTITDDRYPARLREIHQAPPFLFARGAFHEGEPAISVVGSRKASDEGLRIAASVSQLLVRRQISVVSGLAAGIDAAAHEAALDAGGRPVGVIGTGINKTYPKTSGELHRRVADAGLLLSQFWPDAPPQKHTFLMRNATMSGYGIATVVVEAGELSGARAQARMAVEHGRPVILTDLVVGKTQWAKALIGRPGVSVASSLAEIEKEIDALLSIPDHVSSALRSLRTVA